MPSIKLNDAEYYYEDYGQGEPVVLIAGYGCDHLFWENTIAELSKHFHVYVFDNRGVGQTRDKGGVLSLELMADETVEFIKALKLATVSIVGQSMGGIIAQIIAKKQPQLIKRLIILNSAPSISVRSIMALEMFIALLRELSPINTVIEASMPWFFSSEFLKNKKNIQSYKNKVMGNPYPQSLDDLARQFHALKQFEVSAWSQSIATPTLVITSNDDIICTTSESKQLLQYAPNAVFAQISGGHSSPIEAPNEVAHAITSFLIGH